ncbi:MAG: PDZ domain-containing protein [Opitutae bacterium]
MNLFFLLLPFFFAPVWLVGKTQKLAELLMPEYRLNGPSFGEVLGAGEEHILQSVVGLYRNEKLIAHGVIVHPQGFILSKASSSVGARMIKSFQGKTFPIRIRKRNEGTDLALWQITSSSVPWKAVTWKDEHNQTQPGNWVISAAASIQNLNFGVVSATSRPIGREGGVMGVLLEESNSSARGIQVIEVLPQAAGDRAGLRVSDSILRMDGRPVRTMENINRILQTKDPGDLLTLLVNRKNEEVVLRVTLGHRAVAFDLFNRNLLMSGPVSKRKDNFPVIIQQDLPLQKEMMGGGLFNLQGHCLGINIARVDRVTNYTLPTHVILPTLNMWLQDLP